MKPHPSDSSEHRSAEARILAAVAKKLGVEVKPQRVDLPGGTYVAVDGVAEQPHTFVEVYAHQGLLKGGHVHKVAQDVLKLITLGRAHPDARLVLAFADADAAAHVSSAGWLAEAVSTWGVEVIVVELPDDVRAAIWSAQYRQVMVTSDERTEIGRLFRSKLASLREERAPRRPRRRTVRLPAEQPVDDALLRSGELAALLGVSLRTLGRWDLPCLRTRGGQRRFRWGEVRARLERERTQRHV